ncbi:MAG: DMT family transporter [Lysobacterales bacterium]
MIVWRLLLLAMIWGSSFLFQRVAVPEVGTGVTAGGRIALAAVALWLLLAALRRPLQWRRHWREYVICGALNSALPFVCFAFAAKYLPAGYSAVLNAMVPMFTVLLAWATTQLRPSLSKLAGVVLGLLGVGVLARFGAVAPSAATVAAFAAGLVAALCYALAALRMRAEFRDNDPLAVATGTQIGSTFLLLPWLVATFPTSLPSQAALGALLMLGLVCTALAYALYFWLLRDAGSERAVTVTLLVPVFAQLWGLVFLHEPIGTASLVGLGLVLLAMALVFERLRWPRRRVRPGAALPAVCTEAD